MEEFKSKSNHPYFSKPHTNQIVETPISVIIPIPNTQAAQYSHLINTK